MIENLRIKIDRQRQRRDHKQRKRAHKAGIWITREKYHIPVAELDDDHLRNIIRLLTRAAERKARETASWYASCPEPRGEMAQVAFDQEYDYWLGDGDPVPGILARQAIWPHLMAELERRGMMKGDENA